MTKDSVVGLGVVGVGSIGIRSALDHFALGDLADKARIVAVCDPVGERAKAAAEKYGVPAWYDSYEALLSDANVDAITLCSPIGLHYKQAMQALDAGKHIHSNKTITTTVDEINQIMVKADELGLKVVSSPGMMLMQHNQRMRRAVLEDRLGRVSLAVTGGTGGQQYHIDEPIRQGQDILTNTNPAWYFKKPGGGPLYDVGVYFLHILTGILGPARQVSAFSGKAVSELNFRGEILPNEMDDSTFITLDFGNQLVGFMYAIVDGNFGNRLGPFTPYLVGTKATLEGARLNGKSLIYETDHQPHVTPAHKQLPESHVFEDIMQLVDWVRDGTPSLANLAHARHVIDIIDSAYQSAASGQTLKLQDTTYQPLPLEALAEI